MSEIPPQAQQFLDALITKFKHGQRDEKFAEWAAVTAAFLLDFWDLLA